ncbi:hypothetical protein [Rhizobium sp. CNPSo 3490]|uniref:hypothetical protein n=1 Tax=Rhizobium sp. CNPSo 3490 TaxID=3021407 RepID=UPI00254F3113|nr:hypothetical protein [Rhizobium sp. CNPSo 3490]MDK4735888.1 hypothetical protein [Rhizobium sp. CNPSo 3490]
MPVMPPPSDLLPNLYFAASFNKNATSRAFSCFHHRLYPAYAADVYGAFMRKYVANIALWITAAVLVVVTVVAWHHAPADRFGLFCTAKIRYEVSGTVLVGDEVLTSSVKTEFGHARQWLRRFTSWDCQQSEGKALAFKARDGRVFLIPTGLCPLAEAVIRDVNEVDIMRMCKRERRYPTRAYIVSTADTPTSWQAFDYSKTGPLTIVAMNATAFRWGALGDDVAKNAPRLLRTDFILPANGASWLSPIRLVPQSLNMFTREQSFLYRAYPIDGPILMRGTLQ